MQQRASEMLLYQNSLYRYGRALGHLDSAVFIWLNLPYKGGERRALLIVLNLLEK